MNRLLFIAALALAALPAVAQNTAATCNAAAVPLCGAGAPVAALQIKPQAVPTSTTVITSSDTYLKTITVSNATASAITFTVADRQGSPIAVLGAVSIAANSTYVIVWPALYWCPGGVTVTSGGAGLTWYGAFLQ